MKLFRGINRILPIRFRGQDDTKYFEAAVIFAAADQDHATHLFNLLCDSLDCDEHDCLLQFATLRPLHEEE